MTMAEWSEGVGGFLRGDRVIAPPDADDLAGKTLAVLGGTQISRQIVRAARDLGVRTVVLDYYEPKDSPAKRIADEHALISVLDVDATADYLRARKVDGVITGYSDTLLVPYARICEKAGLPCYGTQGSFVTFTDKSIWKERCRTFGVPTALSYDESIMGLDADQIDFPLLVKPADGSGARGVSIVHDKEGLAKAVSVARGFSKTGRPLIEKYLNGPEVTVFWLFVDGVYYVNMIGNRHVKHNQEGVIPLPAGYTFPSAVLPRYLDEVAPRVRRMLAHEGVRNGMMFMQCVVQDGLPYVYDIGYRLTGSLEHHIQRATAGYSCMDMLIRFALTGRMSSDPTVADRIERGLYQPAYNISVLMRPGTVGRFTGIDALADEPSVIAWAKAHVEGETLPPAAKGELRQISLRVLGATETAAELPTETLRVQGMLDVLGPDDASLMLPGLEPSDFADVILPDGASARQTARGEAR